MTRVGLGDESVGKAVSLNMTYSLPRPTKRACVLGLLGLCFLTSLSLAIAQTSTGEIDIIVLDRTGAVIPRAQVTITGTETGNVVRRLATNAEGIAPAPLLPPEAYDIVVDMPGFKKLVRNRTLLRVGEILSLQLQLDPGTPTQSITVVGHTPLLEQKSVSLSQVVERRDILQLPLNGRNYLELANLAAGAVPSHGSRDQTFSAYGNSGIQNAFLLDGARNENYLRGLDNRARDILRPPLDALAEFGVETSGFSAEYGASAGGVVTAVTKNGTNDIHGSAYEFLRNSALDAADFFALPGSKPLLVRNQFGGSLGAPLVRNRAWLFGAYEGTGIRNDQTIRSTVPTLAMKQGIFDGIRIYDPLSTRPNPGGSGFVRTQFPNNTIRTDQINPLGQAIVNRYPDPNLLESANNFVRNAPQDQFNHNATFRGDLQLSGKDSMFGRLSLTQFNLTATPGLPPPAQTPVRRNINSWGIGYGYTRTVRSTLVNEFRLGWTRMTLSQDATVPRDEIIPGMLDPKVQSSIPTVTVTGFAQIGAQPGCCGNNPLIKTSGVWDIADNVSKSKGRHLLKYGADAQYIRPSTFATLGGRGSFGFNGVFTQDPQDRFHTGNSVADLLLGVANTLNTGTIGESVERGHYLGGYVQDQWTLTRNLTLNLGLRYELFSPYVEIQDRMANFILDPGDPLFGHMILAGDPRKPRALVSLDKNNLAPRVGFAYRVPGVKDLVIRSSYGIFYAQDDGWGVTSRMTNNPPFFGFGGTSIISDQLFPASGFVLSSSASAPRAAPINPKDFVLNPQATSPLVSWNQRYTTPYVQEWHLSIQKQLPWNLVWETSYVGNICIHLWGQSEGNQPQVNGPGSPTNRRPLVQFTKASIKSLSPWNRSNYEGLSTRLEKRLSAGVSLLATFTYGHAMDLQNPALDVCDGCAGIGGNNDVQNSYNLDAQRGPSDQDVPLRFVLSGIWDLPFGRGHRFVTQGWSSAIAGSWQASAVYQAQSGYPFTINLSFDNANAGTTSRPDRICDGRLPNPTVQRYYDTSCFQAPPQFVFGNSGRNMLFGPGRNNLDFAVHRLLHLPLRETSTMEVRAEAFNLFNHSQFGQPGSTIGPGVATTGVISGTSSANRQLQFALRLAW